MMIAVKKEGGILRHISTGAWLQHDFIAGLTIMALLVPEGMAYAEVAGMPPEMVL
jgi:MFS superfamily sulfate permease-like transporter